MYVYLERSTELGSYFTVPQGLINEQHDTQNPTIFITSSKALHSISRGPGETVIK
jgi:hypothetical protein